MVMPSGWRNSQPVPAPRASGNPPSSAAMVVIMMGRKRKQARLVDGLLRRLVLLPFRLQREVDHHDGVLLHDADQQDDADQRDHVQVVAGDQQRQNCAHAGRGKRGENRDGMDVALIEHSQHDVNGDDGRQNQPGLAGQRLLKGGRGSLEAGLDAFRHVHLVLRLVDHLGGLAQGNAGGQIEGQGHRGELAQVIDRQRRIVRWSLVKDISGTWLLGPVATGGLADDVFGPEIPAAVLPALDVPLDDLT